MFCIKNLNYIYKEIVSKRVKEIEETEFYQMKESEYKSNKPIKWDANVYHLLNKKLQKTKSEI